jgi:translocator protein
VKTESQRIKSSQFLLVLGGKTELKEIGKLLGAILLCQLAGAIGSIFTIQNIPTWYASLNKPWFNPPNWVFGPVWITLYTMMGISAYLIWRKGIHRKDVKIALGIFAVQLILNTLWSVIFFGLKSPLYGIPVIALLWLFIALSITSFYRISKPAAILLIPYILWVSFAGILNVFIWMLN